MSNLFKYIMPASTALSLLSTTKFGFIEGVHPSPLRLPKVYMDTYHAIIKRKVPGAGPTPCKGTNTRPFASSSFVQGPPPSPPHPRCPHPRHQNTTNSYFYICFINKIRLRHPSLRLKTTSSPLCNSGEIESTSSLRLNRTNLYLPNEKQILRFHPSSHEAEK